MNKDLGVWTYQDCALVLIDYQKEMFDSIRSETATRLADLNVRLLAKTARAFGMPIVLSTVGVAYEINSPTVPSIPAELSGIAPIDRTSMNAFEDKAFSEAVKKTGRKRLIIAGLHTEICLTFAVVQALKDGYDVMFVTDAVGGRSQVRTGRPSNGWHTPGRCRTARSPSRRSSSAIGARPSLTRRVRSSIGTSPKFRR